MRPTRAMGLILVLFSAVTAATKTAPMNVKLGLWKMTYTLEQKGGEPERPVRPELLARMSPGQRARTKAKLKARASQLPHIETKQYCLTEEKLKNFVFTTEESKTCQRTVVASTPKGQQFREECAQGGTKRTADTKFEALDTDTVKGSMQVKAGGSDAKTMSTKIDVVGKWIGSDCGNATQ